jgi:Flp pilus assembly protein TadG
VGTHGSGRRSERGAAAVEFALVVPLLLVLLFGTVTAGMAYSDHLGITNAVREGARFGSAMPYQQAAPLPVITPAQWADSIRTRVQQVYFNAGSSITTDQICVKLVDSTDTGVTGASALGTQCGVEPTLPSGMTTGSCVVKVWVSRPESIQLVIAPTLSFNIGAKSVSYYGLTTGSCAAS